MQQQISIPSHSQKNGFNWGDFFSFRKMITLQVIQVVYVVVAIFLTLGGLISLFSESVSYFLPGGAFTGLILLIFGNILWRMWCELIIVFFRMNNTLSDIDANTKKDFS